MSSGAQLIALTHLPSPGLEQGERTHLGRAAIDFKVAQAQHLSFRRTLEHCGARVLALDLNGDAPDAVFIEDTAVVLDEVAILAPMGVKSRRNEPAAIEPILRNYREVVHLASSASLEGGDVLRVGRKLLVGVSGRTDAGGFRALATTAGRYGYETLPVEVRGSLHLKTACTALPDGRLVLNPAWVDADDLGALRQDAVTIPEAEPFAANLLLVDDEVCIAGENAETLALLERLGYSIRSTPLSEFAKAEGGPTCLALVFPE